jgi:hypothetical protein
MLTMMSVVAKCLMLIEDDMTALGKLGYWSIGSGQALRKIGAAASISFTIVNIELEYR